jgi:myosin heavy subunit
MHPTVVTDREIEEIFRELARHGPVTGRALRAAVKSRFQATARPRVGKTARIYAVWRRLSGTPRRAGGLELQRLHDATARAQEAEATARAMSERAAVARADAEARIAAAEARAQRAEEVEQSQTLFWAKRIDEARQQLRQLNADHREIGRLQSQNLELRREIARLQVELANATAQSPSAARLQHERDPT